MKEKKFVLWGHGLKEYQEMFNLKAEDLNGRILEFGAGATSFNAELSELGKSVISIDQAYALSLDQLKTYVNETFKDTLTAIEKNKEHYNLKPYGDVESLVNKRKQGLARFFSDYDKGLAEGRYLPYQGLPLPFEDYSFNLAIVSHHLFVNYEGQTVAEHLDTIIELLRVAGEVRIFPLIDRFGQNSNLLGPVLLALQERDISVEVKEVSSQLQPTGNAMLRAFVLQCDMRP